MTTISDIWISTVYIVLILEWIELFPFFVYRVPNLKMASQFVMTYKFGFFGEELIEILGLDRELGTSDCWLYLVKSKSFSTFI